MKHTYTAVILGAGPAGLACAVRLAQLGASVAVVERDQIGGICINWGCTPSKAMIESAKVMQTIKKADHFGIDTTLPKVNFDRVAARRDQVIAQARSHYEQLIAHYGIDVYYGEGEPLDARTVRVQTGTLDRDGFEMRFTGETIDLECEHLVLGTGSQPLRPTFIDHDDSIVSSNRLIRIEKLPQELTIIGGGIIGLEFATIFSNLGTKVRIIEYCERVLHKLDPDISATISHVLKNNSVEILCGQEVTYAGKGRVELQDRSTKKKQTLASPLTLVAIGREAVIKQDWCKRLQLKTDRKGIVVNEKLQTNTPKVWAIGDTTGRSILAHVGMKQGTVCAENIMGKQAVMDYSVIPAVVYTLPEIACVGTVPENLKGIDVVSIPMSTNLRATIDNATEGFLKIWLKGKKLLAAQMIGHNVSEFIQELSIAIALNISVNKLSAIIHAHPTLSEINKTAFDAALGQATDYVPQ